MSELQVPSSKPGWLEKVVKQEELLRFESFTPADSLRLGMKVIELATSRYDSGVAVRVLIDNVLRFSHFMDGTSMYHGWWMDKKLNVARITNTSTMRAHLEMQAGIRPLENRWYELTENFAAHGGCFPIKNVKGEVLGYAMSSAYAHEHDHQLLVDAMADMLGISVPSLLED